MEKIILKRLNYYLESKGLLAEEQAGFRSFRSTNQHVALLSQCIKDALDKSQVLSAVFIDLRAAYDKVWRENLLLKLSRLGVRANLFKWFQGFLCQRSCRVRYGSALSKSKILKTGLPQGAVSSCSLFNIYINDLVLRLRAIPGVRCLLYADDLVIWTVAKKINAIRNIMVGLSSALTALENWCDTNNMEVNLDKTFSLTFSLMHQPLDLQLTYKGIPIPKCDSFKYLGMTFDRKLTWKLHADDIINRASRRLSVLKRLAGARWGCSANTLLQTYHTFIRPLLTYCCEPLIVAGQNVLDSLERIQNQSLRIVSGAVKTTPIDAMLILTGDRPLITLFQERALILWERIIRVPGCYSLWREVSCDLTRNLKTQIGFIQGVFLLKNSLGIDYDPEQLIPIQNPTSLSSARINLDLCQEVIKNYTDPSILRALAYEVINTYYPEPNWLHIYTDGSLLASSDNAGAGIFSDLFSFYAPVGRGTAFDGEVAAIRIALGQLLCHLDKFVSAVILSDSKAALMAIASDNNPLTQDVLDCRHHLVKLTSLEKFIALQWVPAHCGVSGNESADYLAKKGALVAQHIHRPLPFCTVRHLIKESISACAKRDLADRVSLKSWKNDIPKLCNGPRRRSVADFRLATGHDCLRKHLFRFSIAASPKCTLCSSGEDMDSAHLPRCSALCKTSLAERYWEARDLLD